MRNVCCMLCTSKGRAMSRPPHRARLQERVLRLNAHQEPRISLYCILHGSTSLPNPSSASLPPSLRSSRRPWRWSGRPMGRWGRGPDVIMTGAITGGGLARLCGGSGICFMPGNPLEWKRWRGGIPRRVAVREGTLE